MELRQDVRVRIPDPLSPDGIYATEGVLFAASPAAIELLAEEAGYKLVEAYDELGAWGLTDLETALEALAAKRGGRSALVAGHIGHRRRAGIGAAMSANHGRRESGEDPTQSVHSLPVFGLDDSVRGWVRFYPGRTNPFRIVIDTSSFARALFVQADPRFTRAPVRLLDAEEARRFRHRRPWGRRLGDRGLRCAWSSSPTTEVRVTQASLLRDGGTRIYKTNQGTLTLPRRIGSDDRTPQWRPA